MELNGETGSMQEAIEKFAAVAREYCAWAEAIPKTENEEIQTAIKLLANLYSNALNLPKSDPGEDIDGYRVSDDEWNLIFKRFGALPFNYYSEFFSPAKVIEEPVTGDLADDLADIYRDIKEGLELYEKGHVKEALWELNQSFYSHWGRHACSALHALHAYVADEDIQL